MTDELTRPLGIKPATSRQARWRVSPAGIVSLVVAALLGAAAGHFYLLEAPGPAGTGQAGITAATDSTAAAPTAEGAGLKENEPAVSADEDEEAESGMAEIQSEGSITPQVPVPVFRRQEAGLAHMPDPALVERGATGVIPRRSPDGLRPMDAYSRPPETEGNFGVARVVIIVGGLGISQTSTLHAIDQLPPSVTLAFAPYGNSLARWMQKARKQGHELLLQVPMQPIDYPQNNPGAHTLRSDVSAGENIANLHWAMSRITNYVGIINYLGGRFIADQKAMQPVFAELRERGLLYVDDGSVKSSLARHVAGASGLPFSQAHIQIDTVNTRKAISQRLDELAAQAKRTGLAIGVASAFPDSIALIGEFARRAAQNEIEITPVSAIVDDPEKTGR